MISSLALLVNNVLRFKSKCSKCIILYLKCLKSVENVLKIAFQTRKWAFHAKICEKHIFFFVSESGIDSVSPNV